MDKVQKTVDEQRSTLQLIEESNQTKEEEISLEERKVADESLEPEPVKAKRKIVKHSTSELYLTAS